MNLRKTSLVSGIIAILFIIYFVTGYIQNVEEIRNSHFKKSQIEFEADKIKVDSFFNDFYKNIRAISLLPDVREITNGNLPKGVESAVTQGWFSQKSEATIQQIYNILALSVPVSEIYCIRDGFKWQEGETPFFMYDNLILGGGENASSEQEDEDKKDFPEEKEDDEYEEIVRQLNFFKTNFNKIPENLKNVQGYICEKSMRTCDNTQYYSVKEHNELDSFGLIYSVPFYNKNDQFSGIISAIIRINNIEAKLRNEPFLVITDQDKKNALKENFKPANTPSPIFIRQLAGNTLTIHDRNFKESAFCHDDNIRGAYAKTHISDLEIPSYHKWQIEKYINWNAITPELKSAKQILFTEIGFLLLAFILIQLYFKKEHQAKVSILNAKNAAELERNKALALSKDLEIRNKEISIILENIPSGLLTFELNGKVGAECSAKAKSFFLEM